LVSENNDLKNMKPCTDAGQQAAPVTYDLDGRTFIVKPVFKEKPGQTLSDTLLRLMRSDFETS
jgi:hypothetical protein